VEGETHTDWREELHRGGKSGTVPPRGRAMDEKKKTRKEYARTALNVADSAKIRHREIEAASKTERPRAEKIGKILLMKSRQGSGKGGTTSTQNSQADLLESRELW